MATYTISPEERRARAKAIIEQRAGLARQRQVYKVRSAYEEQERSRLAVEKAEREESENANFLVRGLSTIGDVVGNVLTGAVKGLEGVVDLGIGLVGAVGGIFSDDFQDTMRQAVSYDFAGEIVGNPIQEAMKYSYLENGGIVEQISSGIGQMLPAVIATIATYGAYGGFAAGASAAQVAAAQAAAQTASLVTLGVSAAGTSTEEAFNEGANYYAGLGYGVASGLVEVGTEKLFGGATKALTGAGVFDGITRSVAQTGWKRVALNAAEEGVEEMVSEAVNPLTKAIYKGKVENFLTGEHWKDIGTAGLVGSMTALAYSGSIGYGLSKAGIGYSGKEADISDSLTEIGSLREKAINLQAEDMLDETNERKIAETTRKNYKNIEGVLKSVSETRRAKLIEKFSLSKAFNADGTMSEQLSAWFNGDTTEEQVSGNTENNDSTTLASPKKTSYSFSLRGNEEVIQSDLDRLSESRAKAYLEKRQALGDNITIEQAREAVGKFSVLTSEMSDKAKAARRKFNKALNALNRISGLNTSFVITEANKNFYGSLIDDERMYISADTFENDTWAETVVHEYTHLEEGSEEYAKMVDFLKSDDILVEVEIDGEVKRIPLWQKAQAAVLGKDYGFDENKIKVISEKVNAQMGLTPEEVKLYREFITEVAAHETQYLLGTEAFIDKIVASDRSLARKLVDKILNLKEAFSKVGDKATRGQLKMLRQAEKLYLDAARKAGDMRLVKYILSRSPETDEEVDPDAQIVYNREKTARYIPYEKVGDEVIRHIKTELKKIYNNEDGVADGIAIEHGSDVYIVDSGRENGSTTFGVRRRRRISDARLRAEFIRSTNNDAISKRFVSDEISSRIGNGLGGDSGRNMRRESRTELQTDSRESQDNQGGVLNENADNRRISNAILSDQGGVVRFNLSTYKEGGRAILEKNLVSKGFAKADVEAALKTMDDLASFFEEVSTKYKDVADWNNAEVYYDDQGRAIYSAMVNNGDYPLNIDLSTICRKRKALTRVLNELVKRDLIGGLSLTADNIVKINDILKKNGFEVACPACFVETKRYRAESWANDFIDAWNGVIDTLNIKGVETLDFSHGKTTVSNGDVDTSGLEAAVKKGAFGGRENNLIAKTILEHPELRGRLQKGDFFGTVGLDTMKKVAPDLYTRILNKAGSATPKITQEFTPYNSELGLFEKLAEKAKGVGGVRMFSFSDFTIEQVFDYMQVVADLASQKATMHTYTKVISFAKIFGKTGIKINMSMIPNVDKTVARENAGLDSKGNLIWSEYGVDYNEAIALMSEEGYSENVGTATIGISDAHIRKLLANKYTNYIIPYHKSNINPIVAKMTAIDWYTDYTSQQSTRYRNGVGENIRYSEGQTEKHPGKPTKVSKSEEFNFFESLDRLGDAKAMAREYLAYCDEHGFVPKFEQFTAEENYYKLLVDFQVYDTLSGQPALQRPAELVFPDNIKSLIEEELDIQQEAKIREAEVFEGTLGEIVSAISYTEDVRFSLRTKEPPKKTITAYKVFFAKNGGLYPPMVANPNGEPTPIGVWLDADIGQSAGTSKTGRPQVKAGGKGTQGGSGTLAFRPGWHLGEYPKATQFNRLNPETGKKELFPRDFVWAECEIAADVNYQEEAMSYGYTPDGKFRHAYAGLPRLPVDGYYQYRTNPDPSTVPWFITGAMKVTRILDDNDVREILADFGIDPIEREGGDIDLSKYGLKRGEIKFSLKDSQGRTLSEEQRRYFKDSKARDESGNLLVVYHGTKNGNFSVFEYDKSRQTGDDFGKAYYFTTNHDNAVGYSIDSGKDDRIRRYNMSKQVLLHMYTEAKTDSERSAIRQRIDSLRVDGKTLQELINDLEIDTGGEVKECYLNLENPLVKDANGKYYFQVYNKYFEEARKNRNDGIIVYNVDDSSKAGVGLSDVYIAFSPEQIKLTSNLNPTKNEDIRFNLVDDPTAKPYFYELTDGQVKKLLANSTKMKVYSKVESEGIINDILGNYMSFGDVYGVLSGKSKAEVIDMLWRGLNTAEPGRKMKVALDVAEYIIQHSVVESMYENTDTEVYTDTIALLKPYLHKINLDGIKGEIKHRYDRDNSPYLLWGKRKGDSGLGADVIAMELDDLGFHIDAINEADIFFQIDEAYRSAVAGLKKEAKSMLDSALNAEERKQLKQEIARQVLIAFDEKGKPSKLSAFLEEYAKKAKVWREKYYEERNKNKLLNRVLDKIQKLKDIKLGTFLNASQFKNDVFKGSIERLANIKYRGNLNESGTRGILDGLAEWYVKENPMLQGIFDEDIASALLTLARGEGKLTVDELKALENVIDYFKHFVETYNKVWRGGQYVEAQPIAEKYVSIVRRNKPAKVGWLRKFFEKYETSFADPMTLVRYMDRYDDGFYTEILQELRKGAVGASVMEMEMREPLEAFYKKHKKFLKEMSTKTIEYQGTQIPLAQAMLLYMSLNRDQAILGLAKSGFTFNDGKETIRLAGFALEEDLEIEEIRVRAKEVQSALASQFTEVEKEYISIAEKLFNETCKEAKKKTDILRRGYTNALEDYYVPIRRANIAHNVDTSTFFDEMSRVSNASFNRDTVKGAKNELFIESLDAVLDRHIRAVAQYANLALAIDQYNLLYNLDIGDNPNKPTSVKTESVDMWSEGDAYFKKLISDIQGIPASKGDGVRFMGWLRGSYAKYQLGANPKVWITQLSSFAAAGNILDIDCIIKGIGVKASDVDEYCGLAKVRNTENAAALAQGVVEKTGKVGDVLMKPIGMVDRFVIARLFGACQLQIEKNEGLKVGTKENKVKAGELLEKVILETQQNALATEKSSAMRSGSELMKTLTMFSADSMKVIGRVVDAIGEVSVLKAKRKLATDPDEIASLDKKIKAANKKARRAVGSLVSSAVFMALVAQLFRWLYNKDDEDDNVAVNMTVDAIGNLLGGLPFIKDIYSYFAEGYDFDNYAYSAINDMFDSAEMLFTTAGNIFEGNMDSREVALTIKNLLYAGGQMFGIPTRNVYNIIYGLTKRISPSTAYSIDDMFYKQNYRSDLAKAIENEDEAMVATITSLMLDENIGGIADSEARKELDSLVQKGFDVIPRSVSKKITYDGVEYELTPNQVKQFEKVYSVANEAIASLVKMSQYKGATDEVKAKAVNFIYNVYYNLALQDFLGVDLETKSVLFAEAIDIEKLAIIVATANSLKADLDKKGVAISGTRKAKIQSYVNSLQLKAVEKYMIMGYLGYKNTKGEIQVKAYINRLSLTKTEKAKLLEYSGYAS